MNADGSNQRKILEDVTDRFHIQYKGQLKGDFMGRDVISSETSFTMQISEPMADKELYHILNPKDDCWA